MIRWIVLCLILVPPARAAELTVGAIGAKATEPDAARTFLAAMPVLAAKG